MNAPQMDVVFADVRLYLANSLAIHLRHVARVTDPTITERGDGLRNAARALEWARPNDPEYRVVVAAAFEQALIWQARIHPGGVA